MRLIGHGLVPRNSLRETLLLSILLLGLPQYSLQFLQATSCGQAWTTQLPIANADFRFSSNGSSLAIGGQHYNDTNFTNTLHHYSFHPPSAWSAPLPSYPPDPPDSYVIQTPADGSYVAAILPGGGVQVFNGSSGSVLWRLPTGSWDHFVMSGDGKYLAVLPTTMNSQDILVQPATLYLLQTVSGATVWSYHFPVTAGNTTSGLSMSISNNGDRIAVVIGRSIYMFSNATNQTLWSKVVESGVTDLSDIVGASETLPFLSDDGNYLTTFEDANVTVFSSSTGQAFTSYALDGSPLSISISKDGSTLATLSGKLTLRDRATGSVLFVKSDLGIQTLGSNMVTDGIESVSLSSDGNLIIVGSSLRQIFVFGRDGSEICDATIGYLNGGLTYVQAADDGRSLVVLVDGAFFVFTLTRNIELAVVATVSIVTGVAVIITAALMQHKRKNSDRTGNTPKNRTDLLHN